MVFNPIKAAKRGVCTMTSSTWTDFAASTASAILVAPEESLGVVSTMPSTATLA
ncbi:MAG: hypothetical protein H6524_14755 [Actinobacteria bacterium]|jgi:hypothetical protein|nr:hypothetical protein [Actinomycetota bacterium]HPE12912.1 hypothetical protein [Actinomycetota bacterium]HPQ84943.1 hypothetical protein [Actinomycetota bacterium]